MRRLPIFLLVDVSESMVGEPLYQIEEGIGAIVRTLRRDPHALETAWLSVIAFAGKARTLVPLTEIASFQPPELPVGGGTGLGAALDALMAEIDREVVRNAPDRKGDWKPLVFLLTDGHPTDRSEPAIARWNRDYRSRADLVAVSVGGGADTGLLARLTEHVLVFDVSAPDAFARFVRWLSQSMSAQTRSVAASDGGAVSLAKLELDLIAPPSPAAPASSVDERFAIFAARCARSERPYLVKYEREAADLAARDPRLVDMFGTDRFVLRAAIPLKASYFELSAEGGSGDAVSSAKLTGQPACPHCAAPFGLAVCGCGGVHCVTGAGEQRCPWCGRSALYSAVEEGETALEVSRGRG